MNTLVLVVIAAILGAAASYFFIGQQNGSSSIDELQNSQEQKPLYWVAPMDANFRRDQPGKSPMGMDLVPVYQEDNSEFDDAGVVSISPGVVQNLGVRTAKVTLGKLKPEINTIGVVRYDEERLIHVHPRIAGWLEKLYVKATGEHVEQGAPLYELYSPELVNAQEEYLLAVSSNEKRLVDAAKSRLEALHIPSSTIEQLHKTKQVKQYVLFTAPQSGVIENLNIREGFYVQPDTTLLSIGDLSQVWVEAQVLERDAPFVSVDDKVTMQLDYLPSRLWSGKVDYIYPSLDPQQRTLRVRLRFNNQELVLKPNMYATVTIHQSPRMSQLLLPKAALIRTGHQQRVVVALEQGKYKSVEVETAAFDDDYIVVTSGVELNDEVVISAQFLLDSESSIASDFRRFGQDNSNTMEDESTEVSRARVKGVVQALETTSRVVTIAREAIEKWQRPAATMEFMLADDIDLTMLSKGSEIDFTFEISDGEFTVTTLHAHSMPTHQH
ncbi:efflux RND transporter periplasmic adaptor subunit [Thalassotalea sp. M1531]|uniref:Efflux RND transporter periplasmic adaptor subunit n=1 Tax=Thalassotalea algicola TaxID=2716224 RepID=A0A7Y0Q551_9GAMM|nr:efflux RND transporter periplasmic adaptor subunit [Thalassotalea algicola]